MEDEIDLGKYLLVLLKHWKIISGITLAAVVISAGVTFLTPPVYAAKATVLATGDVKTLLDMAKSPAVAAGAAEKLAGKLDAGERSTGVLLSAVTAVARDNFIDITAKSTSQQKAADMANALTEAYINYATDYYKKLIPTDEELKAQTDAALALYNKKNEALSEIQEQIKKNDKSGYAELLYEVQMLRQKLESAYDQTPDNALSQAFYQYEAKAYSMMFPGTQISPEKGQVTLTDVDQLINMLEKEAGLSGQSPEVLLPTISEMRLKNASENMTMDGFIIARDAARSTYQESVKQSINAEMARQSPKPQLRSIDVAVPVDAPVTTVKWVNIGIAFVLGLIAGIFAAFVLEYFQNKKPARPVNSNVIAVSQSCEPKARQEAKQSVDSKT